MQLESITVLWSIFPHQLLELFMTIQKLRPKSNKHFFADYISKSILLY